MKLPFLFSNLTVALKNLKALNSAGRNLVIFFSHIRTHNKKSAASHKAIHFQGPNSNINLPVYQKLITM